MRAPLRSMLFCSVLLLAACASETTVAPSEEEMTPAPDVVVSESPEAIETESASDTATDAPCTSTSRKSFEGRPIISVTAPCPGDALTSPATVAGEANVFEATVSMRILDEQGTEIAKAFTTAECGTGCWGAFVGEIEFDVTHEQTGTLEVFESSAEDGRDLHKVSIEVTLLP